MNIELVVNACESELLKKKALFLVLVREERRSNKVILRVGGQGRDGATLKCETFLCNELDFRNSILEFKRTP